jgi:hypothetical protein
MATVARAVHYAHQHGILHRDLKPANILLDTPAHGLQAAGLPTPMLTDFGLAKRLEGSATLTQSGGIVGTPGYMAPEQAAGKSKAGTNPRMLSTAADVYSLGAILYELVTGRPPFRGETPLDTLLQVRHQEPQRPRLLNPGVDRDLETICLKCLAKEPQRRYSSAEAVAEDLERWLAGEPIKARPVGPMRRLWRWSARRPALAALTAALVLFLLIGCSAVVWQWQRAELSRMEAELAFQEAEAQRQRAGANFRTARAAVDQMLTSVAEQQLAKGPPTERVRKELLESALQYYQTFLGENSTNPAVRQETGRALLRLGDINHQLGRHAEAARISAKLAEEFADRPDLAYAAACTLAQCIPLAEKDAALAEAERSATADRYGRRAVELLRAVIKGAYKTPEQLQKDEKLAPLRGRPDFQQLLTASEIKSNPE